MEKQCKVFRVTRGKSGRLVWCPEYDTLLKTLVQQHGGQGWKEVAAILVQQFGLEQFTAKRCRERWLTCVNPSVSHTSFSEAEELALIMHHSVYHTQWTYIAKLMSNRGCVALKNNFYSLIKRISRLILLRGTQLTENTPLFFLQSVHVCLLMADLLQLSGPPCGKGEIVPAYIYDFVMEKRITIVDCEVYLDNVMRSFLALLPGHTLLSPLLQYEGLAKLRVLYSQVVSHYQAAAPSNSMPANEFIVQMLEQILNPRYLAGNSQPVTSRQPPIVLEQPSRIVQPTPLSDSEEGEETELLCCSGGTCSAAVKVHAKRNEEQKMTPLYGQTHFQDRSETTDIYQTSVGNASSLDLRLGLTLPAEHSDFDTVHPNTTELLYDTSY